MSNELLPLPTAELLHAGDSGEWSGLIWGEREIRQHIKFCEEKPSVENWWEPLFTADQMREYAIANLQAAKPADQLRDATKMVPAEGSLPVVAELVVAIEHEDYDNTKPAFTYTGISAIYREAEALPLGRHKLTDHAQATAELANRDEIIERYSMCIRENQAEINSLRDKLEQVKQKEPAL